MVGEIDMGTGKEQLDALEDEKRNSAPKRLNRKITSPDSVKKIITAIKKIHRQNMRRSISAFRKILIFAVNDMPICLPMPMKFVRTCQGKSYGQGDDFVMKITGSPTVDRPLAENPSIQKSSPSLKIVVTVDMLTTGVDIPAIEMVVFHCAWSNPAFSGCRCLAAETRLCHEIKQGKSSPSSTVF